MIVKPAEQAPLSTLRFAELIDGLLPTGVFNICYRRSRAGEALVADRDIAMLSLIGSVATGRAVMRCSRWNSPGSLQVGQECLDRVCDADPSVVADAMISGMNFTWCGQSAGQPAGPSFMPPFTTAVLQRLHRACAAIRPGLPTELNNMVQFAAAASSNAFSR